MLLDYVAEYGSIAFDEEPVNHLDLLAFSLVCNFDFPPESIGTSLPEALRNARLPMVHQARGDKFVPAHPDRNDMDLSDAISKSSRYREVRVCGFEKRYEERVRQFAGLALMIDDVLVVTYRGTDNTFTGWRATLKLSFDEARPSHQDAAEFLARCAERTDGPIVVCGHSKGGNLAMYAAASCDDAQAMRIAQVIGFDAPGLPSSVRASTNFERISPTAMNFIPRSSVVGTVHRMAKDDPLTKAPYPYLRFIKSRGILLQQHYPYSWLTSDDDFVYSVQSIAGKALEKGLGLVIAKISDNGKNRIIDGVFDVLERSGRATFDEMLR